MNELQAKYLKICPIDKKEATVEEILKFQECYEDYRKFKLNYQKLLKKGQCHKLKESESICEIERKITLFKNYFKKTLNYYPFNLQLYWAKRLLKNESFSIIAPTGFGKSTFGIIFCLFSAQILKEKKIYYLVPTKILVNEIERKFNFYNKDKKVKILTIKKTKDKNLLNEDYDILITTSQFLHKNFDLLSKNFNLIYIDDADSMIRQPKNIDKILKLIGFKEEEIEIALRIVDLKRKKNYQEIEALKKNINFDQKGKIIVASATLTPRTKRINLFRELLNFEIGFSHTYLRNIVDFYFEVKNKKELFKKSMIWIKKLGKGGFIFLSDDFKKEDLNIYLEYLRHNNISCLSYEKFNSQNRLLFEKGEIHVVVGFSNIRNPLTRGIDLPHIVRYSLFVGVPKFKIPLKITYSPRILLMMVLTFQEYLSQEEDILNDIKFLKKYSFLREENILENKNLKNKIELIQKKLENLFQDKNFLEKIKNNKKINLLQEGKEKFLVVADARGYIQASGRTSRLFPLGLTQGLSILLVEDKKSFDGLKNKLKIIGYDINFLNIKENKEKLVNIIPKIDKDRMIVKEIIKGERVFFRDPIKIILVIVESPTKAKTIANFFGKPAKKIYKNFLIYEVSLGNYLLNIIATIGHFIDLVYQRGYYGVEKIGHNKFLPIFEPLKICLNCYRHIDINDIRCPVCNSQNFFNKEFLIDILRNLARNVQKIFIATDPDTEGEKIAYDLFIYLYPYNQNIARIELHEITREEFLKNIKKPRKLNIDLVCAQITRRIADRWIGFSLSEKIQNKFKNLNLSAGRVQTPVLGWTINNEIKRKENKIYILRIFFENNYLDFQIENKEIINTIKKEKNNLNLEVNYLEEKIETINPLPPFQTSDLLKSAWLIFKFDLKTTMSLAQDLFERGLITYHRTDSIYISEEGQKVAYEFLSKQNKFNLFHKRSWGNQGTHEGIRPTKPLSVEEIIEQLIINQNELLSKKHLNLYGLIFKRFIASQCRSIKVKKIKTIFSLKNENKILIKMEKEFISEITESGFNEFYSNFFLLNLPQGNYQVKSIKINRFPKYPPYTQASIIDEMKNKGLGRPSTYSLIIETLLERKYLIVNKGYLIPTKIAKEIYTYLLSDYSDLIDENFTKKLEKNMDLIEKRKIDYQKIIKILFKRLFQK
ncbi:MAG: reverse gyrase [Patescibacteria group bacterium]|nr:reverse gyrase [Patescibacteria group bacterium]